MQLKEDSSFFGEGGSMNNGRLEILGGHNIILTDYEGRHILAFNEKTGELEWRPAPMFFSGSIKPANRRILARILTRLVKDCMANGRNSSGNGTLPEA